MPLAADVGVSDGVGTVEANVAAAVAGTTPAAVAGKDIDVGANDNDGVDKVEAAAVPTWTVVAGTVDVDVTEDGGGGGGGGFILAEAAADADAEVGDGAFELGAEIDACGVDAAVVVS